jgi:hypothetical protein
MRLHQWFTAMAEFRKCKPWRTEPLVGKGFRRYDVCLYLISDIAGSMCGNVDMKFYGGFMYRAVSRASALLVPVLLWSLGAGPAVAAAPVDGSVVAAQAWSTQEAQYRVMARRLKDKDPRWEVRSAARTTYISDKVDAATKFFSTGGGYMAARDRATTNAARNNLLISRAIATSSPLISPIVHLTATRAQYGTLDEKDRYVKTGLAEARALDAAHSPVEQAKAQAKMDREYVADLAENASGEWVREAAHRAVELGTDNDIADFFKYSWASAADCDVQAFRLGLAEQEAEYRDALERALVTARDAQTAYEETAGAAKIKAAEDARSAWNTAADVAASTQETWRANQELAASQAQAWQVVRDFALEATTDQDWAAIAGRADGTRASWTDEVAWAQEQAQLWTQLELTARTSATAIPVIAPATAG